MSDVKKLREEISAIVGAAGEPLTSAAILDQAKHADDKEQFSQLLFSMARAGEIKKHPAPPASGIGVRFLYGIGGGRRQETGAGGGDLKREGGRGKGEGKNPKARRAKHAKRPSTRLRTGRSGKVQRKSAKRYGKPVLIDMAHDRSLGRWALTSDAAFVLLDAPERIEISRPRAQALVDFIRVLDKGQA